jgi:hypothetical protein
MPLPLVPPVLPLEPLVPPWLDPLLVLCFFLLCFFLLVLPLVELPLLWSLVMPDVLLAPVLLWPEVLSVCACTGSAPHIAATTEAPNRPFSSLFIFMSIS